MYFGENKGEILPVGITGKRSLIKGNKERKNKRKKKGKGKKQVFYGPKDNFAKIEDYLAKEGTPKNEVYSFERSRYEQWALENLREETKDLEEMARNANGSFKKKCTCTVELFKKVIEKKEKEHF